MSLIESVVDSIWFGRQIRSHHTRVMRLHSKVLKVTKRDSVLEMEMERCLAKLQKLLHYAENNQVMTQQDSKVAENTLSKLQEIQRILKEKRSWWEKLLEWVSQAIELVQNLLRVILPIVRAFSPVLPPAVRQPILALIGVAEFAGLLLPANED